LFLKLAWGGMQDLSGRPLVLVIATPAAFGGSNRSVANFMAWLRPRARCALASPRDGKLLAWVTERQLFDEHIPLPYGNRFKRLWAAVRIASWAIRNRDHLTVIHAQATTGLNLAVPAAFLSRVPVVARISDPVGSTAGRMLGPWVRRLVPRLTVVPVSETALTVAVANGLCEPGEAMVIPEPIIPEDVVARQRPEGDGTLSIGFLGGATLRKGFDLLPAIVDGLRDLPIRWLLFVSNQGGTEVDAAVRELLSRPEQVEFRGRVNDVRLAYAQCDIVLVASRSESFCLVVAEAMANGIPVVATDLGPIRALLGNEEAGLMFPSGEVAAAVVALRRLIADGALRSRLGRSGQRRAERYAPDGVYSQLAPLYGITGRPGT